MHLRDIKPSFTYFLLLVIPFLLYACENQLNDIDTSHSQIDQQIDSLIQESKTLQYKSNITLPIFDNTLKKAYDIAKENKRYAKIGSIYIQAGKRHRNNSQYSKAIWYFQQAESMAENNKLDDLRAKSIHEMAVVFRRMNDNAQAHRLYIEALEWAEAVNDTFLIHCSLNGIGNVHFNYNDFEKSIEYYHRSLKFLGKTKRNLLGEAINMNTLGEAWLFLNNSDSALYYLNKSFEINKQLNSKLGQAICYNGIGLVHHAEKNYQKAILSFQSALAIDQKDIDLIYVAMFLNSLGDTYLAMKNYPLAEQKLMEAYKIASKIGSRNEALDASSALSELYQKTNNTALTLHFMKVKMAYNDSITNDLVKNNSEAMNTLYKAERQEREIIILKQNSELDRLKMNRHKIISFSAFIIVLIAGILAFVAFKQKQLKSKINQIETEQRLLRSQLNPHFLFNSLAALQNFIIQNDKMAASDYLANFSRLMRNILLGSRTDSIVLETEIELLEDYLKLQQLRFNNRFTFEITVDQNIDSSACTLPPMLVQPFIENSIEHGMREIKCDGLIKILFNKENDKLKIIIDDNGTGIKENTKEKKHISLATKITKERLSNYQRLTKTTCDLEIINKSNESFNSGVTVVIKLPYKEE